MSLYAFMNRIVMSPAVMIGAAKLVCGLSGMVDATGAIKPATVKQNVTSPNTIRVMRRLLKSEKREGPVNVTAAVMLRLGNWTRDTARYTMEEVKAGPCSHIPAM